MTSVMFQNGRPLFLRPYAGSVDGQIVIDSDCCCPQQPPDPPCVCGDFCSYFIEIVAPSEVAVKTPIYNCPGPAVVQLSGYGDMADLLDWQPLGKSARCFVSQGEMQARSVVAWWPGSGNIAAVSGTVLDIYCGGFIEGTQQPFFVAVLTIDLTGVDAGYDYYKYRSKTFSGTFQIPGTCVESLSRECSTGVPNPPDRSGYKFIRLPTPLEITVAGDGTSSLGNLSQTAYFETVVLPRPEMFDALAERANWTFRITARQTCESPCIVEVGGEDVEIGTINPEGALDVEWTHEGRTLQVPDGQQTFDYWYGLSMGADTTWYEQYSLGDESRQVQVWQLVAGGNPALESWQTSEPLATWAVELLNDTTCRITGCVQTFYDRGSIDVGVRPYQASDYRTRALWKWTCDIVSGAQQAVTYELLESYRYEWNAASQSFLAVTGGDTGDAPVVTVTISP